MSSPDDPLPRQNLQTMQMIAGALLLGVVVFLIIALLIVSNRGKGNGMAPTGGFPMISILAVVLAAVEFPLAFVVPAVLTRNALRQIASGAWRPPPTANAPAFDTDTSKLLAVRQTTRIIGLALLEGAAFLGCIAYLLEAQPFALGVPLAAILLMLMSFPTESRIRAWLERQIDRLSELRQQGDVSVE